MRSGDEVELVRSLVERGFNDCAIARLTGLPRTTVRDWRISKRWLPRAPIPGISGRMSPGRRCGGCGGALHDLEALPDSYAYLLGLYLGDGCLSEGRRGVLRLRIVLDERYAGIINGCVVSMARVLPSNRPHVQRLHSAKAVEVGISSKQLRCLFPQHAPGRKHERRIVLADWQERIVARRPDLLLRGLIHSRYNFSNRSDDIRRIFCHTCDELGIEWRVMNWWDISVARRESVARLDEFVGPQA